MCRVRPPDRGIPNIRGLGQSDSPVSPTFRNVPYSWGLPITKHKVNFITNLKIFWSWGDRREKFITPTICLLHPLNRCRRSHLRYTLKFTEPILMCNMPSKYTTEMMCMVKPIGGAQPWNESQTQLKPCPVISKISKHLYLL